MANDRNGNPIVVGNDYVPVGEAMQELADGRVVLDLKRVRWVDVAGTGQPTLTADSVDLLPAPAGGGGATDLAIAARTGTTLDVTSSTGADATVPAASATEAGLMTAAEQVKLAGIEAGAVAAGAAGDAYATSHEADATAHDASEIVNVPAGGIAATTVQAAIDELDTEKAAASHVHSGADITSGTVVAARLPAASETASGIVELSTSAETTAGLAVQASDTRLSDARTPTAHTHAAADITSGTVAAARMPALTGDITTTVGTVATTIGAAKVTMAMLANVATDKLIGRDASGSGAPTEIGVTGAISFNGANSITIANAAVTSALLRDSAALSVIGRSANSSGVPADIAASTDGHVLQRSASTLIFGVVPDLWTYSRVTSDQTTSSGSGVDITSIAFTPAANKRYQVEGTLLMRSASTAVSPRFNVVFPTGMTDGVASLQMALANGTYPTLSLNSTEAHGNIAAAFTTLSGSYPDTTSSYPVNFRATLIAGASPSGTFKLQVYSSSGGTNVTVKAGSWISWKEIP